ncbi:MAG TPA: hypothetical protein VK184_22805 [Nostocaceae cyanobacterium]|nr:hypothetical protein [Nostocaceae cyanobacterium]
MTTRFSPLLLASIIAGSTLVAILGSQSESFAKEVCTKVPGIGKRCIWVPVADEDNSDGGSTACFFEKPVERVFHIKNTMNFAVKLQVNNDAYTIPAGERWRFTAQITSGGDCGGTNYGNPVVSFDDDLAPGYQSAKFSIPENREYYFGPYNNGARIGLYPR